MERLNFVHLYEAQDRSSEYTVPSSIDNYGVTESVVIYASRQWRRQEMLNGRTQHSMQILRGCARVKRAQRGILGRAPLLIFKPSETALVHFKQ